MAENTLGGGFKKIYTHRGGRFTEGRYSEKMEHQNNEIGKESHLSSLTSRGRKARRAKGRR